ncbi:hypothetical protein Tco_0814318 [Tanacetum coccineum]
MIHNDEDGDDDIREIVLGWIYRYYETTRKKEFLPIKHSEIALTRWRHNSLEENRVGVLKILKDDEMHVEAKVDGKEEQSIKPDDSTDGELVTTATVDDSVIPTTIEEITLDQTLIQIKAAKPKVVTTTATTTTTIRPKDKGVVVQEPKNKEEGREETTKRSRKNMLGRKRAGKEQQKESSKKQKVEEEKESEEVDEAELKKLLVIKKDEDIQMEVPKRYSSMIMMLQGIDRKDLEALWRIVKEKYGDTRPDNEFKRVL